jgi:hypothetical protein
MVRENLSDNIWRMPVAMHPQFTKNIAGVDARRVHPYMDHVSGASLRSRTVGFPQSGYFSLSMRNFSIQSQNPAFSQDFECAK